RASDVSELSQLRKAPPEERDSRAICDGESRAEPSRTCHGSGVGGVLARGGWRSGSPRRMSVYTRGGPPSRGSREVGMSKRGKTAAVLLVGALAALAAWIGVGAGLAATSMPADKMTVAGSKVETAAPGENVTLL